MRRDLLAHRLPGLILLFTLSMLERAWCGQRPTVRVITRGRIGGAWLSGDGSKIAFNSCGSNTSTLCVIVRKTGRLTKIYRRPVGDLVWSSGGRFIATINRVHTVSTGYRSMVVVLDAVTGKEVTALESPGILHLCGWFPDGTRILLEQHSEMPPMWLARAKEGDHIRAMDIKTGKCRTFGLTKAGRAIVSLDLSPKNGCIAATADEGNIVTFFLGKDGLKPVTHNPPRDERNPWPSNSDPRWSPDGQRVAYWRQLNAYSWELWKAKRNGHDNQRVAPGNRVLETITWSADSNKIAWFGHPTKGAPKFRRVPGLVEHKGFTPIDPGDPGYNWTLYIADVRKGVTRAILSSRGWFNLVGWDHKGVLVCSSPGAIFEVKP